MKYICFCSKSFYDLSVDEIRSMRRGSERRIELEPFLDYYGIDASEYFNRLRQLEGIRVTREERRASFEYRKKIEKAEPEPDDLFTIEKLPDIFVAALYEIDFEIIEGKRLYDVEEIKRAREDVKRKVDNYRRMIEETKDKTAYSTLRGIDLVALRVYRGKNRKQFSKLSGMNLSEIIMYESGGIKIPSYIQNDYYDFLNVGRRHLIQLRDVMLGKSNKVMEDRAIPSMVKVEVFGRDQGKCTECNSENELHFHHIKRFADGGQHTVKNLKLLCRPCHAEEHKGEKGYHLLK